MIRRLLAALIGWIAYRAFTLPERRQYREERPTLTQPTQPEVAE